MVSLRRVSILGFVLVALASATSVVTVLAQAPDPIVGNWQLNVAKSKFNPGPALKSESRSYVVAGQEIRATSKTVDAEGKAANGTWTINYDGKDRSMTGSADADMLSLKRIDSNHAEFTQKKGGTIVATGTRVISPDGKVMTITTKGTNAKGQAFNDVEVYDRR